MYKRQEWGYCSVSVVLYDIEGREADLERGTGLKPADVVETDSDRRVVYWSESNVYVFRDIFLPEDQHWIQYIKLFRVED